MSKLLIHFRNKSIKWHVIKFNALRDQHGKVCEPQFEKHSWYVEGMPLPFAQLLLAIFCILAPSQLCLHPFRSLIFMAAFDF